jgi:hypothetical protein
MPINEISEFAIFAIYPNANGYGFVFMKDARTLIDYGSVRINPISNRATLSRVQKTLIFLKPSILIMQDPKGKHSRTGKRVKNLIKRIVRIAKDQKLPIKLFTRDQVRHVFEQFGAKTKYEISQILLTEFTELASKAPKKRKLWTSEDRYMAIFDALSLATTWFYLNN